MNSNKQQQHKIEWQDKNIVIAHEQFTMKERQTMYLVFETVQQKILHEMHFDYSICYLTITSSELHAPEHTMENINKILKVFVSYRQVAVDKFGASKTNAYWWHIKVQYQRVKFLGYILSELRKIEQNG